MTRRPQSLDERLANIQRQMVPGTLGGRIRSAGPISAPLGALTTRRVAQTGGREYATLVVAAADTHLSGKNAADYVCTGANDDVTIQAALDDTIFDTLPGGRVMLLEGTYAIQSSRVIVNYDFQKLEGQGPGTILRMVDGANLRSVISTFGASVTIANLLVDANGSNQTGGISAGIELANTDSVVTDCIIQNTNNYGVILEDDRCTVMNCRFTGCSGMVFSDAGQVNQRMLSNYGANFGTAQTVYALRGLQGDIIAGNVIDNPGAGIWTGSESAVEGNVVIGSPFEGIFVSDPRVLVRANVIIGSGWSSDVTSSNMEDGSGISFGSSATYSVIENNIARDGTWHGIYVGGSDSAVVGNMCVDNSQDTTDTADGVIVTADNCHVQGNMVRGTSHRYGVRIESTADKTFCSNNDVKNGYTSGGISNAGTNTVLSAGNRT